MYTKMIKNLDWIELGMLNVVGVSVSGWLLSLLNNFGTCVAALVGVSVVILNCIKIYGVHLDNKIKKKKLND